MKESIIIQNVGPLKEIDIEEIKPLTVLIGESGSGKSTLMKIIVLMRYIYKMLNIRCYLKNSGVSKSPFKLMIKSLISDDLTLYLDDNKEAYIRYATLINGHEYVDLGLSVLWATCNIGATSPEDKGSEFPFVYPDWYKENGEESWYRQFRSLNLKPDSSICGTYLDIAKDKWGDKWRLPSKDEIRELDRNCDSILIPKVGLKLTSKINGNKLYFPFSGATYSEGFYNYNTTLLIPSS